MIVHIKAEPVFGLVPDQVSLLLIYLQILGAIELSKEALSMIAQGFPEEKLHISCFNTVGYLMKPKHYSAKGIRHMLKAVQAGEVPESVIDESAFRVARTVIKFETAPDPQLLEDPGEVCLDGALRDAAAVCDAFVAQTLRH